ncbi:hypothetical protein BN2537_1161 [Streptomyces venezuelae]|nr:hypothetical protein BN2537_1161 [Streptomyces venezuelae]
MRNILAHATDNARCATATARARADKDGRERRRRGVHALLAFFKV